jgi:hypothetical protein
MSKLKELYVKGMNAMMLDCDQAMFYATKYDLSNLSFMKRLQLKMHLKGCEFCKTFVEQSEVISKQISKMKEIDENNLKVHLTKKQKVHLNETVENNLKNN